MKIESNGRQELHDAAAPILQEMTRLAGSLPPRIAVMVAYIRDHLFDPRLSVNRVKVGCHFRDNSIALQFHREVGAAPGNFITDRRLAVAERLLAGTWLPIWKITELLGYSSIQVFSRAYSRRKGIRPSEFRRRAMGAGSTAPEPVAVPSYRQPELPLQALVGELDDHQAAELIRRLLELYPPARRRSAG